MEARAQSSLGLGPMAAVCSAAIGLGGSLVLSSGDALFLHRVGAEHLGIAFAISSALLVVVLALVGARADRGGREKLVLRIALGSAVLLIAAGFATSRAPQLSATIVLIGGKQMTAALELAFWVLLAERFDARQLRHALPRLIAAHGAGIAVGAVVVALLANRIGVPALVGTGACVFAAAGVLTSRLATRGALRALPKKLTGSSSLLGLREGARATLASPVASHLVVLIALGGAVTPIVHYLLGLRASAVFTDEASLATFFGTYRALVQLATVAAQAFIASRVIARLGVGPALVCLPIVVVAATLALSVRPELAAVVIAQAAMKLVDGAIETPAHKLAQNLTARESRGRVTGFLDGVAKRAGAIVGGLLAAVLAPFWVTAAAVSIGALWLVFAARFRSLFPSLAVAELEALTERSSPVVELDVDLDKAGIAALRAAAGRVGPQGQRARVMLETISAVDYSAELVQAIAHCDDEIREALAAALGDRIDCGLEGMPSRQALAELARSEHEELRLIAARYGAEPAAPTPSPAIVFALSRYREGKRELAVFGSSSIEQGELCRALARGDILPSEQAMAVRRIARLARQHGGKSRAALVALSTFSSQRIAEEQTDHARQAEWLLISGSLLALGETLASHAESDDVRAAALELFATVGGKSTALEVAGRLGSPSRPMAKAAVSSLRRMGADAIEALLRCAVFGRRRARGPALDLLRELRVPPDVLDGLIDREAEAVTRSAVRIPALAKLPSATLLERRVRERLVESAHTLFLLLETRHERPAIGAAARRLRYARHRAARARAIEALDAALPRRFSALLPILEGARPRGEWSVELVPTGAEALRAEVESSDRLARRIAIFALGQSGRSKFAGEITRAASSALESAEPSELAARLVSLMGDRGDNDEADMSRSIESVLVLSELELFSELSTRELADLARVVKWVSATPGEVLMTEGEVGDAMYFVVDGEVTVVQRADSAPNEDSERGGKLIATLGRGEPFGEMALFDDEVRSATVSAVRAARLGRIERPDFEEIAREVPGIALGICRVLSRRVRGGQSE